MTKDKPFEISMRECTRNNLCVDCDNERCWFHGNLIADCPKWRCDRQPGFIEDCETCEFLKEYQKDMREYYDGKAKGDN